jgi:transposase-like protein
MLLYACSRVRPSWYAPTKRANANKRKKINRIILAHYKAGVSTTAIAAVVKKHVKTVQRLLKANGVRLKHGPKGKRDHVTRLFGPPWITTRERPPS